MTVDIANIAFFAIFEVCIFFTSVRITYFLLSNLEPSKIQLAIVWLVCDIIISSTIAEIFSFVHYNGSSQYVISSVILVFSLHMVKKSNLKQYKDFLVGIFDNLFTNILNWKMIVAFSFFLPILLWVIRPIDETDSLFVLNYMFGWISNNSTPYVMQANYVAFWELTYLPSMIITHTDNFLWLASFKSIILAGLTAYLVGRQIGLPSRLCWATTLSCILFVSLWINPSGIGTLKNDLIFACGVILITVSLLKVAREDIDRLTTLLFSVGISFVLVKYQGILITLIAILVLIIFNKRKIFKSKKNLRGIAFFIIVVLVTSGHYYVYHIFHYGNPVYPFSFTLLGHTLNGNVSYPNTSIISSIGDSKLYHYLFFTPSNITMAGLLFPILIIFGIIGTLVIGFRQLTRFLQNKIHEKQIIFLSFFIFITWVVFFFTPLSAHAIPGDFVYIKQLSTMRYAEGTLIITELFLIYVLWKIRIPQYIIFAVIGIDLVSRIIYLYSLLPTYLNYSTMVYPILIMFALAFFKNSLKKIFQKIIVVAVLGLCVLVLSPQIVEANKNGWAWWWNDVIMKIEHSSPSNIYLIAKNLDDAEPTSWATIYPILGDKFQHSIQIGNSTDLLKMLQNKTSLHPDYIAQLCNPNVNCTEQLIEVNSTFSKYNYKILGMNTHAIILKQNLD